MDHAMNKKLEILKLEIDEMVDNFQIEIVRQFQIQSGTLQNLMSKYMIDEETYNDTE